MHRSDSTDDAPGAVSEVALGVGVDDIPDAVVVANAATGRVVAANAAAGRLFHCRPDDLVGGHRTDLHPADDGSYAEAFRRAAESERVDRLWNGDPLYVETFDGEHRPVEINAERVEANGEAFVLGVFRDVSDRLDRERRFHETTARLETLLDALPLPAAVIDTDGIVERWNRAAEETFGYDSEAVVGEPYPLSVEGEEFEQLLARVLDGKILDGHETVFRAENGSRVEAELYARPLYDGGDLSGIIGVAIDVSERQRRIQHLDVLHRTLRHNLRNQLGVVRGWSETLATAGTYDEVERASEKISNAAENLQELSEQAKELRRDIRGEPREPRTVPVRSVVSNVRELVEGEYPEARLAIAGCPDDVGIPGRAESAVTSLFRYVLNHLSECPLELTVEAHARYVELSLETAEPVLPEGDQTLVNEGRETDLSHGNDLGVAHVNLVLQSIGGDLSTSSEASSHALCVEIPRKSVGSSGMSGPAIC